MTDVFEFSQLTDISSSLAKETMKSLLESKKYNSNKVGEWIDNLNSSLVTKLRDTSPNFKYIVSTSVVQKVGAGIHFEAASYWDNSTDGSVTVKYENDSLIGICTVFGIAI